MQIQQCELEIHSILGEHVYSKYYNMVDFVLLVFDWWK